jgi:hypothetical protein
MHGGIVTKTRIAAALFAAAIGGGSATAAAQQQSAFSVGTGVNYTTGDYGTGTNTSILSIPFTAKYETGRWTFKASVPWLEIDGANAVVPGVGPVANTNPRGRGRGAGGGAATSTSSSASGLGDVVLAATYTTYYNTASRFGVDVTGRIKLPTADQDKGLGTGETDYGAYVELYRTFGQTTVFGGGGYTDLGSSDFIRLNNVYNASIGASHKLSSVSTFGATFDMRERSSPTAFPQRELTAFFVRDIAPRWKGQAYVMKGFADGSPDWGAGALLGYVF